MPEPPAAAQLTGPAGKAPSAPEGAAPGISPALCRRRQVGVPGRNSPPQYEPAVTVSA